MSARIAAAVEELRQSDDAPDAAALSEAGRWLTALAEADGGTDEIENDAEARLRARVGLSSEADFRDPRADRVSLLTMHAAKGLEFPVVFVVGLEDGLVPFSWSARRDDGGGEEAQSDTEAEERRLFYVAVTRAKDRLFLIRAAERVRHGRTCALPPSPFLRAIPEALTAQAEPAARKRQPEGRQYSLF